jgi:hypothetical protein
VPQNYNSIHGFINYNKLFYNYLNNTFYELNNYDLTLLDKLDKNKLIWIKQYNNNNNIGYDGKNKNNINLFFTYNIVYDNLYPIINPINNATSSSVTFYIGSVTNTNGCSTLTDSYGTIIYFYCTATNGVTPYTNSYLTTDITGYVGNYFVFNLIDSFDITNSKYYDTVTFSIQSYGDVPYLLQEINQSSMIDKCDSTFNIDGSDGSNNSDTRTYNFNWSNYNNWDQYTGANFSPTYYSPFTTITQGLCGPVADNNIFITTYNSQTGIDNGYGGYSYFLVFNSSLNYWGYNNGIPIATNYTTPVPSYLQFSISWIPDNSISLLFFPAEGSRGNYTVSNNVIYQTGSSLTNYTASAFLAMAYNSLGYLSPTDSIQYGIGAITGTWQIDMLCSDNTGTFCENFYLTYRQYLSTESPTNIYYIDGQTKGTYCVELDLLESNWGNGKNSVSFESNIFIPNNNSVGYQSYPISLYKKWIRIVGVVSPNSINYYYYEITNNIVNTTPLYTYNYSNSSNVFTQPLYPYITIYQNVTNSNITFTPVTSYTNYTYSTNYTYTDNPLLPV